VNTFRIVKEQISGILLIGCLFVIFALLWFLNDAYVYSKAGIIVLTVLGVIWNIAQLVVLWNFFFTNWKTAKMTSNMN